MNSAEEIAKKWPLGRDVRVLAAHPAGLIVFEKPAGLMAHPNRPAEEKQAMVRAPYDLERECYRIPLPDGGKQMIFLLNRIDSPTSGLVLGATDLEVARVVRQAFKENKVHKTYFALVKGGRMQPARGRWIDRLARRKMGATVRMGVGPGGIPAATDFLWRRSGGKKDALVSLLELFPLTGRTHQLRVQCAAHHAPIVGDKTYGDFAFNRRVVAAGGEDRLFLHAAKLELVFPWKGRQEKFRAESPLPESFATLLGG